MEWCDELFCNPMLLEMAKVELTKLEEQHPNQHEILKEELRDFIHHLQGEHQNTSFCSDAPTQASSTNNPKNSNKKRKSVGRNEMEPSSSRKRITEKNDRVEMVLQRARLCLHRIRELKSTFCTIPTKI